MDKMDDLKVELKAMERIAKIMHELPSSDSLIRVLEWMKQVARTDTQPGSGEFSTDLGLAVRHCQAVVRAALSRGDAACAREHSQLALWLEELRTIKHKEDAPGQLPLPGADKPKLADPLPPVGGDMLGQPAPGVSGKADTDRPPWEDPKTPTSS